MLGVGLLDGFYCFDVYPFYTQFIERFYHKEDVGPSTLGGRGGGSRGQDIETILVNMVKPCFY